eukprot:5229994-Lingulodinium_polyedra.AAC.1
MLGPPTLWAGAVVARKVPQDYVIRAGRLALANDKRLGKTPPAYCRGCQTIECTDAAHTHAQPHGDAVHHT